MDQHPDSEPQPRIVTAERLQMWTMVTVITLALTIVVTEVVLTFIALWS
jgi:hypothetical protein